MNYAPVTGLLKRDGQVRGVLAKDAETGMSFEAAAKLVVNATGIFSDELRRMDEPAVPPMLTVSQGTHFVLPRRFLPGSAALMIPKTSDGRVLFAIPWHESVVVGTTDNPVSRPAYEPHALAEEQQFLAANVERFLGSRPARADVRSMWSGQRPLVKQPDKASTAAVSRDHTILIAGSRLVTITGGKWTTYRRMGQDVIDRTNRLAGLAASPSVTADMKLHGWVQKSETEGWSKVYGSDLPALEYASLSKIPLWVNCFMRGCPSEKSKWSGRQSRRWRARWKMFSRGERVLCFWTRPRARNVHRRQHAC